MPLSMHLGVILALLLLNALYVASEFAAVSARRSRVRPLAEQGNWFARKLLPVLESPPLLDRYIATSQVGITVTGLALGAYAEATVGERLSPIVGALAGLDGIAARSTTSILVLLVLTVVQVLFAELVPKYVALQFPSRVALATVAPISWTGHALKWFISLLNGSAFWILRLVGSSQAAHQHVHSPDEIALLLSESHEGGLLEPAEHRRLQRALHLTHRTARELMVPRRKLAALEVNTPLPDALDYIIASPYTRLPVYDGNIDHVLGLLHTKDVVRHTLSGSTAGTVGSLVRPAQWISPDTNGEHLLRELRERRCHQMFVRDGDGTLLGLVTLEDVLAELVGRVGDELKAAPPESVRPAPTVDTMEAD